MSYNIWKDYKKKEKRILSKLNTRKRSIIKNKLNEPLNDNLSELVIISRKIDILPDIHYHEEIESLKSLMICAADNECLIDRYDGRALLDKIPKKSTIKQNFKSSKEENLLNYERYKPLIEFFKKNISEEDAIKMTQDELLDTTMAPTQIEQDEILSDERYMKEIEETKLQESLKSKKFAPVITEDVTIIKDDLENEDKDEDDKCEPIQNHERSIEEIDDYALTFGIEKYSDIANNENNNVLKQSNNDNYDEKPIYKAVGHRKSKQSNENDEELEYSFNIISEDTNDEIIQETYIDQLNNEDLNKIYEKSMKLKAYLKDAEQIVYRKPTKMELIQKNIRKGLDDIINDDIKKRQNFKREDNNRYDSFGRIKKDLKNIEVINNNHNDDQNRKRKRSESSKKDKKTKHNKDKKLSKIEKMLKELEK